MGKIKNSKSLNVRILLLTFLSMVLQGCSMTDNMSESSDEKFNTSKSTFSENDKDSFQIFYGDTVYTYSDGFYRKEIDSKFIYEFKFSNFEFDMVEEKKGNYLIINKLNPTERFRVLDLIDHKNGYITFNIETKDNYYRNFVYKNVADKEINSNLGDKVIKWELPTMFILAKTIEVVSEIVLNDKPSRLSDSALKACQAAMKSLRCPRGKTPYMEYRGGSWFNSEDCNVGCR